MAKTNEQFDQHFREKLEEHREKPSKLAWERLDSQLPNPSKPKLGVWWTVAASVTALLVAGYSFWPSDEQTSGEPLLAEKTEIPAATEHKAATEVQEVLPEVTQEDSQTNTTETPNIKTPTTENRKSAQKTKPTPLPTPSQVQTSQNLIAQAEPQNTESQIILPLPELQTEELQVAVPELKAPEMERAVAEAITTSEDEPAYRISIYSNGIKKAEPVDKNLITELGKTVGQVEGLLGKVDEGFAEIQDRKDNLFAGGISIKKTQSER